MKVARKLGRNSWGYELDLELKPVILEKVGYGSELLTDDKIEYEVRDDSRRLRTVLQEKVKEQKSVVEKVSS